MDFLWNVDFQDQRFQGQVASGERLIFQADCGSSILAFGWMVSQGPWTDWAQHWHRERLENNLLEASISVWCMNIKQCSMWKQYITRQVLENKQKAGHRPGPRAKSLVKDSSSWRNDNGLRTAGTTLRGNNINYTLKMRRVPKVALLACLIVILLLLHNFHDRQN